VCQDELQADGHLNLVSNLNLKLFHLAAARAGAQGVLWVTKETGQVRAGICTEDDDRKTSGDDKVALDALD